ncbi:MAG: hypothetical protein V1722_02345 [Candidatus Micrarchaeota archaeon]
MTEEKTTKDKLKFFILSRTAFKRSPYWQEVKKIIEQRFEQDKIPGESKRAYLRAFTRAKKGHGHALVVNEANGDVIAHFNDVPLSNPTCKKVANVGHGVTAPNKKASISLIGTVDEHLKKLGFSEIRSTYYSKSGAVIGRFLKCKEHGITRRGKLFNKPELKHYSRQLK